MTQIIRNGLQQHETFNKFFECWIVEQNQHLQELVSVSKEHDEHQQQQDEEPDKNGRTETQEEVDERSLVERVIQHYERYYRAKSRCAKNDVLSMFNPSWRSSLEDAFLWISGWRPSMAFHLLYSKSGLQLEARLADLIQGLSTGDLADLSPSQLNRVNELQKEIIREERKITEKLAKQQATVADSSMVELTHAATELMRQGDEVHPAATHEGRVEATLAAKEIGLVEILQRADDLRLKTLKEVLTILTPIQGVHFLIAAAELHLRVHEWGKNREVKHRQVGEDGRG